MWDISKRFDKYYFCKKYVTCWDFLGGPGVKTLGFHRRGLRFPTLVWKLRSRGPRGEAKKTPTSLTREYRTTQWNQRLGIYRDSDKN